MKRKVVFEFEVDENLENIDVAYQGAIGSVNIAHEMIKRAVLEHQMDVILRASQIKEAKEPGREQLAEYIMRFHEAQKTLQVVGYFDENNNLFMKDEHLHFYVKV